MLQLCFVGIFDQELFSLLFIMPFLAHCIHNFFSQEIGHNTMSNNKKRNEGGSSFKLSTTSDGKCGHVTCFFDNVITAVLYTDVYNKIIIEIIKKIDQSHKFIFSLEMAQYLQRLSNLQVLNNHLINLIASMRVKRILDHGPKKQCMHANYTCELIATMECWIQVGPDEFWAAYHQKYPQYNVKWAHQLYTLHYRLLVKTEDCIEYLRERCPCNCLDSVILCWKQQSKTICHGCEDLAIICKMHICSACQSAIYCSKECQLQHWNDHKKHCELKREQRCCDGCGILECSPLMNHWKFLRCGRCKAAFYCTKECQTRHWNTHKACCKKVTPKNKQPQLLDQKPTQQQSNTKVNMNEID